MSVEAFAKKADIGPAALQTGPGNPFFMSRAEFIDLQTYCHDALQLPISRDEMHGKLGIAEEDEAKFDDMTAAYKAVHDHCLVFNTDTFPATVSLASDIVDYGRNKVPVYYGNLMKVITMWQDGTLPADKAQAKLEAMLDNLKADAEARADKAHTVAEKVSEFARQTEGDKATLDPIKKKYTEEYAGSSGKIEQLNKAVDLARSEIDHWNEEYKKDCIIAATSATYAWIFPFGTIAAASIAGVYGQKARDALDEVHNWEADLAKESELLRRAILLMHDLNLADNSLDGLTAALDKALPVIAKMKGIWNALSADLANVLTGIKQNIEDAPLIIKDLGVDTAIDQWTQLANEADAYRVYAFINVVTPEEIEQHPEKYAKAA